MKTLDIKAPVTFFLPKDVTEDEIEEIVKSSSSSPKDYFRFSAESGHTKLMRVLRERFGLTDKDAREPWVEELSTSSNTKEERQQSNQQRFVQKTAIRQAAIGNHFEILKELREGYGLSAEDAGWNSNNTIFAASKAGSFEAVRELVEGYEILGFKKAAGAALRGAAAGGHVELIRYLFSKGATREKVETMLSAVFIEAKNAETLRVICNIYKITKEDFRKNLNIAPSKTVIWYHSVAGRDDVLAFLRDELGINTKEDAEFGLLAVEKNKVAKGKKTRVLAELKKFGDN